MRTCRETDQVVLHLKRLLFGGFQMTYLPRLGAEWLKHLEEINCK